NGRREIKLDIIGDGEMKGYIKEFVKNNKLEENVILHGTLFGEKSYKYFLDAHIMVIPGAVGLSILHAYSFGLPIITSKNSSHGPEIELFKEGITGSFYNLEQPHSLSNKIVYWQETANWHEVRRICIESIKR